MTQSARPIFYSGELWRSFDLANISRFAMIRDCLIGQALLGATTTVVSGFSASQQSTPNMTINVDDGQIFQLAATDGTAIGAGSADSDVILQHGYIDQQVVSFNTAGLTGGQQQWALVQGQFEQLDIIPSDDPDSGIIPFVDTSNPGGPPLEGPDGLGGTLNTVRQGIVNIDVVYGAAATAGSAVPPVATTGWVPLYLILISNGQTSISNGEILVAGDGAYSGYPDAPFLAGLLNSHHGGTPGQAPKINLATETTGTLGFGQLPGSNNAPVAHDGTNTTAGPYFSVSYEGPVNPNGNWGGAVGDRFFQTGTDLLWECTTAGNASSAIWSQIGFASGAVTVTSWGSPFVPSVGNFTYNCNTTGIVSPAVNLLTAAAMKGNILTFIIFGSPGVATVLNCASGEHIIDPLDYSSPQSSITLQPGQSITLSPVVGSGYLIA